MKRALLLLAIAGTLGCGSESSLEGNYYPLSVRIMGSGQLSATATYSKACLYVSGVDFNTVEDCKEGSFSSGDTVTLSVEVPEGTNRRVMVYLFDTSGVPTHEGVAITDVKGPTTVEISLNQLTGLSNYNQVSQIEYANTNYISSATITENVFNLSYDSSELLYQGGNGNAVGGLLSCYQPANVTPPQLICDYDTSSHRIMSTICGRTHLCETTGQDVTLSTGSSPPAGRVLITGSVHPDAWIDGNASTSGNQVDILTVLNTSQICYYTAVGEFLTTYLFEVKYTGGSTCSQSVDFSSVGSSCLADLSTTTPTTNCPVIYGNFSFSTPPTFLDTNSSGYVVKASVIGIVEGGQYWIPMVIMPATDGYIERGGLYTTNNSVLCFDYPLKTCPNPSDNQDYHFALPFLYDSSINSAWLTLHITYYNPSLSCDFIYKPMWKVGYSNLDQTLNIGDTDLRKLSLTVSGSNITEVFISPRTVALPYYFPIFTAYCGSSTSAPPSNPTFEVYTTPDLDSLKYVVSWNEDRSTQSISEFREYGVYSDLNGSNVTVSKVVDLNKFNVTLYENELLVELKATAEATCELEVKVSSSSSSSPFYYTIYNIPYDITFIRLRRFDSLGSSASISSVSLNCYNQDGWVKVKRLFY